MSIPHTTSNRKIVIIPAQMDYRNYKNQLTATSRHRNNMPAVPEVEASRLAYSSMNEVNEEQDSRNDSAYAKIRKKPLNLPPTDSNENSGKNGQLGESSISLVSTESEKTERSLTSRPMSGKKTPRGHRLTPAFATTNNTTTAQTLNASEIRRPSQTSQGKRPHQLTQLNTAREPLQGKSNTTESPANKFTIKTIDTTKKPRMIPKVLLQSDMETIFKEPKKQDSKPREQKPAQTAEEEKLAREEEINDILKKLQLERDVFEGYLEYKKLTAQNFLLPDHEPIVIDELVEARKFVKEFKNFCRRKACEMDHSGHLSPCLSPGLKESLKTSEENVKKRPVMNLSAYRNLCNTSTLTDVSGIGSQSKIITNSIYEGPSTNFETAHKIDLASSIITLDAFICSADPFTPIAGQGDIQWRTSFERGGKKKLSANQALPSLSDIADGFNRRDSFAVEESFICQFLDDNPNFEAVDLDFQQPKKYNPDFLCPPTTSTPRRGTRRFSTISTLSQNIPFQRHFQQQLEFYPPLQPQTNDALSQSVHFDAPGKPKLNLLQPEFARQGSTNSKSPRNKAPGFQKSESINMEISIFSPNQQHQETPNGGEQTGSSYIDGGQSVEDKTIATEVVESMSISMTRSEVVRVNQSNGNSNFQDHHYYGRLNEQQFIGRGSQANVFLVQMPDGELAAVKRYELLKNNEDDMKICEKLSAEFALLQNIEHKNIIRYKYLYQPKRQSLSNCVEFGIIMEYMEGGPLDAYIDSHFQTITIDQKKSLIKQILEGLDALHSREIPIAHRDLKPGNILLSGDYSTVKISDFGFSKQEENNVLKSFVGSPAYMAPEVASDDGYSTSADIWSAGGCFFQLITGERPYHSIDMFETVRLLRTNKMTPLEVCEKEELETIEKHEHLLDFLQCCFNKDKDKRSSARELLEHPFLKDVPSETA